MTEHDQSSTATTAQSDRATIEPHYEDDATGTGGAGAVTLSDDLRLMSRIAPTMVDQATLLAAAMVIDETLRLLQELVDMAKLIGTPVCEDGFRHCCGGGRRRCKVSCPVAHLRARLRDDDLLGFYGGPPDSGQAIAPKSSPDSGSEETDR